MADPLKTIEEASEIGRNSRTNKIRFGYFIAWKRKRFN